MSEKRDFLREEDLMTEEELTMARLVNGEVRISLKDYHDLISWSTKNRRLNSAYSDAVEAFQKYLTFLRTKEDLNFDALMDEFNKENPDLTMYINGTGKVRINLNLTRE